MKPKLARTTIFSIVLLAGLLFASLAIQPAAAAPMAQEASTATPQPPASERPIVLIESYYMDVDSVSPGKDFNLFLTISNQGQNTAMNILFSFTPGDLIPRETGGTIVVSSLDPGQKKTIKQPMTVSTGINGGGISNATVNVSYTDNETTASYSAAFNVAIYVNYPYYAPAAPTKTPTPINVIKPQLAITGYTTDVDPLQPGMPFKLTIQIRNLGNADAKSVTMITGGGTGSLGGLGGTPEAGGVSGSSGEFTNFAPLKSSNIHFVGDVTTGQEFSIDQPMIVNTTTQPGAYSLKFSFVYVNSNGVRFIDDQVITLLVYQLPLVEITFYHDPGVFYTGQPGQLPIQITNLSRKATILGNLKANVAQGGTVTNNTTLIGAMDPGGYFTLDATITPDLAGPMDVDVSVSYTDDFNQPQIIHQTLHINVEEMVMPPDGGINGGSNGGKIEPPVPTTPETFMQKLVRFFKGLIGLDSSVSQPSTSGGGFEKPTAEPGTSNPIIVQPPMKGG